MPSEAQLPCAMCGECLARQPDRGCVAMTCDLESLTVSRLVVCCQGPCLERHAEDGASILADEDLASYLGGQGAGARARLLATFAFTEDAARNYMDFTRAARAVEIREPAAARLAS